MKLALFGATKGIGAEVTKQALAHGHSVRALARDPAQMQEAHPSLAVIQGNVLDLPKVEEMVADADAVICVLGNTGNNPRDIVSQGTANIVAAMQGSGAQRLLVVSSIGVGESKPQVPFFFRLLMWTVLRQVMQDKERQEAIVCESGLQWTIVRPGGLTDGPYTGNYRHGPAQSIRAGRIARADVAAFLLRLLEEKSYVRKAVSVS